MAKTIVTFNQDVYPYVRGDVVVLTSDELEAVDTTAERRGLDKPYTKDAVEHQGDIVTPTIDSDAELAHSEAADDEVETESTDVEQAKAKAEYEKPAAKDASKKPAADTKPAK